MRRLVCACVVRKPLKTGFLAPRPISLKTIAVGIHLRRLYITSQHQNIYILKKTEKYSYTAPFFDNPMCYVKYLAMHKVQMHAGAKSKLSYGFASAKIYSLKLVDYLSVQTHKPYTGLAARKPVFGVSDKASFKLVSLATEAS